MRLWTWARTIIARLLAFAIDATLLFVLLHIMLLFLMLTGLEWDPLFDLLVFAIVVFYFGMLEGSKGFSIGKRILGLRVDTGIHSPRYFVSFGRSLLVLGGPSALALLLGVPVGSFVARSIGGSLAALVILVVGVALSDGTGGFHDAIFGSRVIFAREVAKSWSPRARLRLAGMSLILGASCFVLTWWLGDVATQSVKRSGHLPGIEAIGMSRYIVREIVEDLDNVPNSAYDFSGDVTLMLGGRDRGFTADHILGGPPPQEIQGALRQLTGRLPRVVVTLTQHGFLAGRADDIFAEEVAGRLPPGQPFEISFDYRRRVTFFECAIERQYLMLWLERSGEPSTTKDYMAVLIPHDNSFRAKWQMWLTWNAPEKGVFIL